ncbi:hypothetical protein BN2475_680013 [Paraburkholderia ribeironis]|uniref:Uncharacterized protein n=1 Tax=Paraburkholderia ribeironis TaxID=1247936 RepID=A0A1N7SGY8_9BURK|nr:hypothetical protein BN2475_680013 [Paraburkholderia ribeironis]
MTAAVRVGIVLTGRYIIGTLLPLRLASREPRRYFFRSVSTSFRSCSASPCSRSRLTPPPISTTCSCCSRFSLKREAGGGVA